MIRILATLAALLIALPAAAEVKIDEVKTPGGLTAWLVEEHSIPFTALEIRFRGGSSLDETGKRGEINLMTGLLEEGAADMDSRAFAEAQQSLAARFGFDVDRDALSISARFLTENRDAAAELLRKALVEPRFDQDAIDRVKSQIYSIMRSDSTDPGKIASDRFNRLTWGGTHPYGTDDMGTQDSVAALTREDMFHAKDRVMAKDRMFIGAVGDITPEELSTLLDNLLGGLPDTGAEMPERAPYQLKPGVTVVPFDTPQSIAIFGHEGIALDDPDYYAAYVLIQALGGGNFSSILMDEVREKRGLTYGIGAYLMPMDLGELIVGQFASANARMGEALDVVKDQWAKIAKDGITEEQLSDAKTYLTGAYPLRFDGNGTVAGIICGMQMNDLPIDYIATRNERIEKITMDDVKRVAARIFRPEDLGFVVVGHPDGVSSTD